MGNWLFYLDSAILGLPTTAHDATAYAPYRAKNLQMRTIFRRCRLTKPLGEADSLYFAVSLYWSHHHGTILFFIAPNAVNNTASDSEARC
ncbi:hypothetical protein [Candidatus Venteria ishoeyi]|uniref:hypothetical protein n=1 Tax=Candidatus Venteria ishoeyi TaxID=1899563 RepID=UPI000CDE7786|nr:hypothetical protein [Candidatus Venteria ishoeyi]